MHNTTAHVQTASIPTNGRELASARRALCLSRGEFAAVVGLPYASVLFQEVDLLPLNGTVANLTGSFAAGFRPDNWPE